MSKEDKEPAFWWEATKRRNRPTLSGEKLLAKVREVLSVPLPRPQTEGAAAEVVH